MERGVIVRLEELKKYCGKKVLVTGHTGFKGSWLCQMLIHLGAEVTGYALGVPTMPSLYTYLDLAQYMDSVEGDVRDYHRLYQIVEAKKPDIVFHLAAQPIVRESYKSPRLTYETNVMGTVNILECVRNTNTVRSIINVTTDKVYMNREWCWGYRENERLDGYDPYSNSKSCSELVTQTYQRAFLEERGIAVSTVRAGNVIGGSDFAKDRIIPDCVRAALEEKEIVVRNPESIRPYQHVLEPLTAYLMMAIRQYEDKQVAGAYNVGPDEANCVATKQIVSLFCKEWNLNGKGKVDWSYRRADGEQHEAQILKLDCSKIKTIFGWRPMWDIERAMHETVKGYCLGANSYKNREIINNQIKTYFEESSASL